MNPFKYGSIVGGSYFINRKQEISQTGKDLLNGNNIILYAPRRYGKTSLVIKILEELKKEGVKTVYLDFFQVYSVENFINLYAAKIMAAHGSPIKKTIKNLKNYIRGIIPSVTIDENGKPVISFSYGSSIPKENSLLDVLDLPDKIKKKDEKWVIVFDEFQEINSLNGSTIEKQFRSVLQFHQDIGYVFMGSKTHLMLNMFADKKRAFYNIGKLVKLDKISPGEMIEHMEEEFNKGSLRFKKGVFDVLLRYTGNIPYYNQYLASQTWQAAQEEDKPIDEETVKKAVSVILDNQDDYYHTLFDKLTHYQRKVIHALLHERENIFSREYARKFNLSSSSSTQRALNSLTENGIIEKMDDKYQFSDPFFPIYLKQRVFT